MPPVRQSARQRARSAAQDHPSQVLHDEVTTSPLVPTAVATGVAQPQLAATDASVADLRREMTEIREMLQSVRPGMAASTHVATDPPVRLTAPLPGPGMIAPPWPTVPDMIETVAVQPRDDIIDAICNLPGPTQTRMSPMITNTLSINTHVTTKVRTKVWSDEFVDMFSLLPEVTLSQTEMALTVHVRGDNGEPTVCVIPRSKPEVRTFYMWSKAFYIFSSVYLLKHGNLMDAPKLLQYRHVIQNLFERSGDWRGYVESFRSLRSVEGWAWDQMHSQLWLN